MSTSTETGEIIYFGKIPSRGDFVRSRSGSRVLDMLDSWIAQGLERLAQDSNWKARYDSAPGMGFAFLGTKRPFVLTGWLTPSADASQRRFPFIAAVATTTEHPLEMAARGPLCVADTWNTLERLVGAAVTAEDPRPALDALASAPLAATSDPTLSAQTFTDFLAGTTIQQIENGLRNAGHPVSLRQSVLSLGLLLTPLATATGAKPDKGLSLPLPADRELAITVAAFWMELVTSFLTRSDIELGLFLQWREQAPSLVLVFDGANLGALTALFGNDDGFLIDMGMADWVEEYVRNDYAITKLSSYLEMSDLSLRQAVATFKEAFLGA